MAAHLHHRGGHYLVLVASAFLLFFWGLGAPSLWDVDEGRNATCAHEMLESGNWIVPTCNGTLRADKPVLLYWLQAAAYRAFGVNEWSARLPSALAALVAVLLAYELGRKLFGKTTGLLGALIAASTPMLLGAARFANPDALLHLFTLLALWIFWLGHRQPTVWWWIGLGAATGLGMLAKGPVAVVLPAMVGLTFLVWEGRWRALLDRRMVWGCLTWLLVAGPWYIWVAVETKARFWRGFFLRHHLDRFLTPLESHDGTPLYYPLVLLAGLAPWSIFLVGACWYGYWSTRQQPGPRWLSVWQRAADQEQRGHPEVAPPARAAYRFLVCWVGVYLAFFTVAATKLPNYLLPAVVPCAILTARMLERWRRGQLAVPGWCMPLGLALWLTFGVAIGTLLMIAGGVIAVPALAGRHLPGLASIAWVALVPLAGAVIGWRLLRRERRGAVLACLALAAVLGAAPLAVWAQAAVNQAKAPQPLVQQAGAFNRTEDLRVIACQLPHLASLNFYTQRDVIHLEDAESVIGYLHYPIRVVVFLPAAAWDECQAREPALGREVARGRDLYTGREVVAVTNQ
jgi:4-amino-4-deoxy-L-arabinose transferase-like glycosyltransferase